jgi:hypothetical protein
MSSRFTQEGTYATLWGEQYQYEPELSRFLATLGEFSE